MGGSSPLDPKNYTYSNLVSHNRAPTYKPTQTQMEWMQSPQPNMGHAIMEVNLSVPITTLPAAVLPNTIEIATLTMKFNGVAKSKNLMTQTFFSANQKNMGFGFQADIKKWLQQFQFMASIDQNDFNLSTAKITGASNDDFSSTETSATTGAVGVDSTTSLDNNVQSESSATLDRDGSSSIASGSNIDGNTSTVSWSSTEPTTITFTFTPKSIQRESGNTDFEGALGAELQITVYPIVQMPEEGEESPQSQTQTTSQTNTLLVSIAIGSVITAAILTFPNMLKWVAEANPAY